MTKYLYENDYYGWLEFSINQVEQLGLLELRDHLEEMSRSERRALESQFARLITHLLKWKYQPDHQTYSWRSSIKNSRYHILRSLKENPSLKSKADELSKESYNDAIHWASRETGIKEEDFPNELEFSLEQLLDNEYFP